MRIYPRSYNTTEKSLTWWWIGSNEASLWLLMGTWTRRVNTFPPLKHKRVFGIVITVHLPQESHQPWTLWEQAEGSLLTQCTQGHHHTLWVKGQTLQNSTCEIKNHREMKNAKHVSSSNAKANIFLFPSLVLHFFFLVYLFTVVRENNWNARYNWPVDELCWNTHSFWVIKKH